MVTRARNGDAVLARVYYETPRLNHSHWKVYSCGDTSKEWGRSLGECLARNTWLESLTIKIYNDDDTSNEWEHGLGEGLARNTSLESFTLDN